MEHSAETEYSTNTRNSWQTVKKERNEKMEETSD